MTAQCRTSDALNHLRALVGRRVRVNVGAAVVGGTMLATSGLLRGEVTGDDGSVAFSVDGGQPNHNAVLLIVPPDAQSTTSESGCAGWISHGAAVHVLLEEV